MVLTKGTFYVSPEKLRKRQVGCNFCFTINPSETEGGLFSGVTMMELCWHSHAGVSNCRVTRHATKQAYKHYIYIYNTKNVVCLFGLISTAWFASC